MVAIGIWVGRGSKDLSQYLLGGRDVPWWAILGSIVATETSTATFLSVPGIAFAPGGDLRFLQIAFGYLVGRTLVAYLLMPLFFRGKIFSAYQILESRFGNKTKQSASMLFLVTRNLGDGLRLFLAGIALQVVLGIDLHVSICVIGIATIIYTFLGGMKAVIWSDCLQLVIYMVGGVVALVLLSKSFPNGWSGLTDFGLSQDKFRIFDFRVLSHDSFFSDTYTFWAGIIGGATLTLGTHGTDQMMVQRYLAARSQRDASIAVVASGVVVAIQFVLFLLIGVGLSGYYTEISPQTFGKGDQVFASYIVEQMPIGLAGLTLAAVFAAAMSTLSSSLNSSSAAAINDLWIPWQTRQGTEPNARQQLNASRWMTVVFGVVQIIIGIGASYVSQSVVSDALAIAGFTAGIMLGVFLLGAFDQKSSQPGVLSGMVVGVVVLTFIKFDTSVAWPWYPVIGTVVTSGVGCVVSRSVKSR